MLKSTFIGWSKSHDLFEPIRVLYFSVAQLHDIKWQHKYAKLKNALFDGQSHVTYLYHSECFISLQHSHSMLTFVYDIDQRFISTVSQIFRERDNNNNNSENCISFEQNFSHQIANFKLKYFPVFTSNTNLSCPFLTLFLSLSLFLSLKVLYTLFLNHKLFLTTSLSLALILCVCYPSA